VSSYIVSHLEQQVVHHRASLVHPDAAMRLFDPDLAPEDAGLRPQHPRTTWFHPGECLRLIHTPHLLMDSMGLELCGKGE